MQPEHALVASQEVTSLAPAMPDNPTYMDLLSFALSKDAAIDVIERLAALRKDEQAREAEIAFNEAMNRVQEQIRRVAPDAINPQTHSKYVTYAALDRRIRPFYSQAGFSLSFNTEDCPTPEYLRAVCYVSLGAHTRKYQVDMPADGKGAKGGDVMTKTHATGAAMSYGMRYLLKFIFNVAVGEEDNDGNGATNGEVAERVEWIQNCRNLDELKKVYEQAMKDFQNSKDARLAFVAAKDARKKEL